MSTALVASCPPRWGAYLVLQLQQSYVAKARATDQAYCGTPDGTVGPVERKLASMGEVEGLVVGAFGEVSAATHALISHMAVSRVQVADEGLWRGLRRHPRPHQPP